MSKKSHALLQWVDARFPLLKTWNEHIAQYYAPKNFNFWYFFGSLATIVLVLQILTGVWLTMNYVPTDERAFASIEYIMRDVDHGWLIRYAHTTGASAFFLVIYLHMFRGLIYGSYRKPRELVWIIGVFIFLVLMAEAFFGYLLPWGQMSFWGAQVITSLFGAIPVVGDSLATLIRGDFTVSEVTLNRFFAFHVILVPLLLVGLVFLHIVALHKVGSNNPDGIEIKANKDAQGHPLDGIPFHPYYTVKDLWGLGVFFCIFCLILFFFPEGGGYFIEKPNFEPADPLKTPTHIAPLWYLTPFYSILRAIPDKLAGVMAMAASIAVFFVIPWLDRAPVKSIRYRGMLYKCVLAVFVVSFVGLGYLGTQEPTALRTWFAQLFSVLYFAFFLLMPWYTKWDKTKPVPHRLT